MHGNSNIKVTRYSADFIYVNLFITTGKQTLISLIELSPDGLYSNMFLKLNCFFSLILYRTKYTLSLCYIQYALQFLGSRRVPHSIASFTLKQLLIQRVLYL